MPHPLVFYYALFNTACQDYFVWRKTPAVMFYAFAFQFNFSFTWLLENAAWLVLQLLYFTAYRFHTVTADASALTASQQTRLHAAVMEYDTNAASGWKRAGIQLKAEAIMTAQVTFSWMGKAIQLIIQKWYLKNKLKQNTEWQQVCGKARCLFVVC